MSEPTAAGKRRPAFQFYPGDWRKDVELRSCSVAARGLWIDMLCLAHECDPYGHLMVNGKPMKAAQIAGQVGLTAAQCAKLIDELVSNGVARVADDGTIYSKRMVADEAAREARAEVGRANGAKGAEFGHRGSEHGKKGGRPKAENPAENPPTEPPEKPPQNPRPSSSSSSSSSEEETPIAPKGAPLVGLKAWLEATKAAGQKAIPDTDPVFAYAERVGLPPEFLHLAWVEFRRRYTEPGAKRYRDWRAVFRKSVEGNWLKLWFLDGKQFALTTVGQQARLSQERAA